MSIERQSVERLPAVPTSGAAAPRARYQGGWRDNKPVEDPEKTKRWGLITARPSEYLIHMRRGRLLRRTSGQGATCFKWPWDSVAIVPTSIDRLQFAADQVTLEKVGVEVQGLAVYRIVDPLLAYRMLNFSFTERASEKLTGILGEMFVGATRRLVANLTVEEVLTRRKDALATELMREIAPVVAGRGRPGDGTDTGWGVVIDTIEVQDVRILSETVFTGMQAAFRAELVRRSREAELQASRTIALREVEGERAIAEARISSDAETRELRARGEGRAAQIELEEQSRREALASEARRQKIARERDEALAELGSAAAVEAARHENRTSEAENEDVLRRVKHASELEHQARESVAAAERRRRELALEREGGLLDNELAEAKRRVENTLSDERLRLEMVQVLPAVAQAFAQKFGEVHLTSIGAGEGPSTLIAGALAQVLEVARAAGISWDRRPPESE